MIEEDLGRAGALVRPLVRVSKSSRVSSRVLRVHKLLLVPRAHGHAGR